MSNKLFKIEFYVPHSHLEPVKTALFDAGAGRLGNYDCCAWQTPGTGQFRPQAGSTPFIGNQGKLEKVAEYKVELLCDQASLHKALLALKSSHPYEEPAYSVITLNDEAY